LTDPANGGKTSYPSPQGATICGHHPYRGLLFARSRGRSLYAAPFASRDRRGPAYRRRLHPEIQQSRDGGDPEEPHHPRLSEQAGTLSPRNSPFLYRTWALDLSDLFRRTEASDHLLS
jgi:hypothetical protein